MKVYLDCVKKQAVIIGYADLVQDKMATTKCSAQEAMDQIGIKKEDRPSVLKQLKASKSAIA